MYNADKGYLYAKAASSGNLAWHNSESSSWSYASSNWKYDNNGAYLRSYSNSSFRTYSQNNGSVLVFAQKTTISSLSDYCTTIEIVAIPVSDAGYSTYCSVNALDFTNVTSVTAYTASMNGGDAVFTPVTGTVPAGTGLLIKGSEGSYQVPVVASSNTNVSSNLLVGVTANTEIGAATGNKTNFVLQKQGSVVAFYKVGTNGFTVRANSAYLSVNLNGLSKNMFSLDDETTGIEAIDNSQLTTDKYFDLQGRRVIAPTKGIYIRNGRKVVIK